MALLEDFLPEVLPFAPGCSDPAAERAILLSGIEFCKLSYCWRDDLDLGDTVADVSNYPIQDVPTDGKVHDVKFVRFGDDEYLDKNGREYETATRWELVTATNEIKLTPTPATGGKTITATVIFIPTRAATTLPDILYDDYFMGVAQGALAHLLGMPGQKWSNPPASIFARDMFMTEMHKAKVSAFVGKGGGSVRARSRAWP